MLLACCASNIFRCLHLPCVAAISVCCRMWHQQTWPGALPHEVALTQLGCAVGCCSVADCCAICCCEYEAGQPTIKLSCSHLFHKECIISWLKVDAVCPICKTHLLPSAEGASADGCYCRPVQTASPEAAEAAATQPALVTGAGQGQGSQAGQQAPDSPSRMQMSPRLGVIALQPCALSVPMVGVAGVSP